MKRNAFGPVLLIFAACALVAAWRISPATVGNTADPGPRAFPVALASFLIVGGVVQTFRSFGKSAKEAESSPRSLFGFLTLSAALAAYVFLLPLLGFFLTTGALAFGMVWWLGRSWQLAGISAVVMMLAVYGLFVRLFKVALPGGSLF